MSPEEWERWAKRQRRGELLSMLALLGAITLLAVVNMLRSGGAAF